MPITKARLKISDYNEKRKMRLRHQERRIHMVSLSLTSMVDMFAILVIFLLTNSSTVSQWIEVSHGIDLPKAKYSDPPPKAASLQVSRDMIYGDQKALVSISQVMAARDNFTVEVVRAWLSKRGNKKDGYVNIVAHHKTPYGVIKRIMATCQDAGFHNINLAVQPKI